MNFFWTFFYVIFWSESMPLQTYNYTETSLLICKSIHKTVDFIETVDLQSKPMECFLSKRKSRLTWFDMYYDMLFFRLLMFWLIFYLKFSEPCPTPSLGIATTPPTFIKKVTKIPPRPPPIPIPQFVKQLWKLQPNSLFISTPWHLV